MKEKRRREEDSDEEEELIPIKPIAPHKLQAFTVGSQKKTAFQKHKEEADLKKKQESIEAAKVYADFVASFEEPQHYTLGTTSFVKSSTMQARDPDAPDYADPPKAATKSIFKPMAFVRAGESASAPAPGPSMKKVEPKVEDSDDEEDAFAKMKEAKIQKKRNLDSFLEEIKKGQEGRSKADGKPATSQATTAETTGSMDDGNTYTTNLYVGNINPTTTETGLCHEFGKYGPIASVKIMWPRTQEEKDKGNNCGFVSFMTKEDAAAAIRNLDGKEVDGFVMRVGWGKAVPIPAQPFFVLSSEKKVAPSISGLPFNAQINAGTPGINSRPRAEVRVVKPVDIQIMKIIHRTIERVIKYGPLFEAAIMDRERQNPKFKFLFDNTSPEHIYYRWKLYSIMQGDSPSRWSEEPFQMFEGGPWWVPPELPLIDLDTAEAMFDTDDELAEQDNVSKGSLGQIAKQRLAVLLKEVTFQRGTIARTMAFAIDHSDAAVEIVEILCNSILLPDSPLSVKLARLYLISDILHNSSVHVSNAWKYRKEFEQQLPNVFDHFNTIYRSVSARLKAEQVRKHISAVISVWENWMIFPKYYTDQLTAIFLKKEKQQTPSVLSTDNEENSSSVDGESVNTTSQVDGQEIDGEPMAETDDVDGEPMDDIDGEPMDDDIDGEPMDDIDGEPMDDIDGEPMTDDAEALSRQETENLYTDVSDMFS